MQAELRQRSGSGEAVVYVPGIDGTGRYLLGTEARLAERFDMTSLRYRTDGEGALDHPALAASIAEVLEREGIGPALILAESFGVAVALQLALDHPERVRALMLVNGFARYERRARLALSRAFAPLVTPKLFALGRPLAARVGLFGSRRDDPAFVEFLAAEPASLDEGYRQRLEMIRHVDLLPRLPELALPVAIYASDKDKVVPSIASGRAMAEHLPNSTFEVIRGAGHLVLPLHEEPWGERLEALSARV